MLVFEYSEYRKALKNLLLEQKKRLPGSGSMAQLARAAGMQPSYLTNVTQGRAHLSADQLCALSEELRLDADEAEFLQILLEWERATHPKRKAHLGERVAQLREKHLRAEKYLSAPVIALSQENLERYYLDPHIELLHLYLMTRSCPHDAKKIAASWRISEKQVGEMLLFLERLKLIEKKGSWWSVKEVHQHLPRESPLCRPQQFLKKLRGIDALQRLPENRAYSFAASVTMTEETRRKIQARFLEFLKECEALVKKSEPERLFQIQFDLFPWAE